MLAGFLVARTALSCEMDALICLVGFKILRRSLSEARSPDLNHSDVSIKRGPWAPSTIPLVPRIEKIFGCYACKTQARGEGVEIEPKKTS